MSEAAAKAFHEAYERLAPSFGYATRIESACPWEAVQEQNRLLMIAVTDEVVGGMEAEVVRLQEERDNLLWLLDREFEEQNPGVTKPGWLVFAASLREAAETEQVPGSVE